MALKKQASTVIVHFCCPQCLAVYRATQVVRRADRGPATFSCQNCGIPVHEWTGPYDFLDWQHLMKGAPEAKRL